MQPTLRLLAVLVVVSLAGEAHAQYFSTFGYSFNNPMSATCNSLAWSNMNARRVYRSILERHGYTDAQLEAMSDEELKAAVGAGSPNKEKPLTHASRFKPARGRLLLPQMANSFTEDPAQRKALLEVLEAGMKAYEQQARSSGLDNNVAGAMAFFIATAYSILHDGAEPNEEGVELLARALENQYDSPDFAKIAAADKQKFYELMVGLATYFGLTYQQATSRGDKQMASAMQEAAAGALRGFLKLEPKKLRITAQGLEVMP